MKILSNKYNYAKFTICIELYDDSVDKCIICEFTGCYEFDDIGDYYTAPSGGCGIDYLHTTHKIEINNTIYECGTSFEELTNFCDYDTMEKMHEFIYSKLCDAIGCD